MPELPEVETVRRKLKPRLVNKKIVDVAVRWNNTIVDIDIEEFKNKLKNESFIDIKRRGKWLMFELDNYYLLVHLRMEGKFFFKEFDEEINKHEHVIFKLDDVELRFHDTRKFGKMYLLNKDDIYDKKPLNELGYEPWDEKLDHTYLKNKYKSKTLPIKEVLLDQKIIVGIGNIYADEILFLSNIDPWKKAKELDNDELDKIILNTREVLDKAIELGGTTIRSYVSLDDKKGEFQDELYVHSRVNKECKVCKSIIKKDFIGGRGTYYCPTCQNVK